MLWDIKQIYMPNNTKESEIVKFVQETFANYEKLNSEHRETLWDIYEEYRNFKQKRKNAWSSSFKINYAHQIVNKVLPRLIAKNPRWLVSIKTDEFEPEDKFLEWNARQERLWKMDQMATWIQAYLSYIWDRYNLREPIRLWAKNMLIYWNAYAKIKFKYEMTKTKEAWKIDEKVIWEYPTIDPISWTNIYVDPRYTILEDMAWIIIIEDRVRYADLERKKDKYLNIDKIKDLPTQEEYSKDPNWAKSRIYGISWIPMDNIYNWINRSELCLKTFYWKYSLKDWDERLYRFTTVNDFILIENEEISCLPIEDIKCFDDTETHFATWIVEPILSLQEEQNFKKNSASEYVNNALNRSWIWSPNSWINPRDLISKPNNIIATTTDAITAQNNLIELQHRNLPTDYFQEQNDIERQIQNATFSIDTSSQKSEQALTNTATWIRVKFFESNAVIDEIRKHLEEGIERLAYKLLQATFENMEDNIVIKKIDNNWFWEINKELLRDALNRYDIKIEANSSAFDDVESRREDSIAFFNILMQGAQMWVPVDMIEAMKDVIHTFEKRDVEKFIKTPQQWQPWQWQPWQWQPLTQPQQLPTDASSLTEAVAKWWLTTWM